jgi:CDP-glycerol glycerophosphotransferase
MIFYVYDHEEYVGESRGTYFDLLERAPGPVAAGQEELFAAVAELTSADREYREARRRFAAEFGEYDQGDAARALVETFFTPGSGR